MIPEIENASTGVIDAPSSDSQGEGTITAPVSFQDTLAEIDALMPGANHELKVRGARRRATSTGDQSGRDCRGSLAPC
jgi:hypothetical protein